MVRLWNGLHRELAVTILGGVQEMFRCGTEGHGLVGSGGQLDWMTLEVFSNLNDSVCDSV